MIRLALGFPSPKITSPSLSIEMKTSHARKRGKGFVRRPQTHLSQNFLIDQDVVKRIVDVSEVKKGDQVLEIGSGRGVLTCALLETGACVIAVEKDPHLFMTLQKWKHPRLKLICEDILQVDLSSLLQGAKAKVVANIPYHITGLLIRKFLPMEKWITDLTLMVQKEVAQRLSAEPKTGHYSFLTLLASHYSDPKFLFTVEKACFYPEPKVTSALVQLKLKRVDQEENSPFWKLARIAFNKRRKMLSTSLRPLFSLSEIHSALLEMGLSVKARPQELSLQEFQHLGALLLQKKKV